MLTTTQIEILNRCDTSKATVTVADRDTGLSVQASVAGISASELSPLGIRHAIATGKGGTVTAFDVPHKAAGMEAAEFAETIEPVGLTPQQVRVAACDNANKLKLEHQRAEEKTAAIVRRDADIAIALKTIEAARKPARKARKPATKPATVATK